MLQLATTLKAAVSHASRRSRADLFSRMVHPTSDDLIVDLGGGRGHHFARYFPLLRNVVIADYNAEALAYAARVYKFQTRLVDGAERLPFGDHAIDIVFCSSVIEHVTGPKAEAITRFKGIAGCSATKPGPTKRVSLPKCVVSPRGTSFRRPADISRSRSIPGFRSWAICRPTSSGASSGCSIASGRRRTLSRIGRS